MRRAIIIVLDSVGIGNAPDAEKYGDKGAHTLDNIAAAVPGFVLPNLQLLGLGAIPGVAGYKAESGLRGGFGRLLPRSAGKDTTTGHWELAGLILADPFPTYPDGFPPELIRKLENLTGRSVLGNCVASGTEIIANLGDEHVRTGSPIVYTSADSVFQIAAHEEIIPVAELYRICRQARTLLQPPHAVGRVIARPFTGTSGAYKRTSGRQDFSLEPPADTILDIALAAGCETVGIGKIGDIFAGRGLGRVIPSKSNDDGVELLKKLLPEKFAGIVMVNLVEFDMLFGHRNDPQGYAEALLRFDSELPGIIAMLQPEDLLLITADHGCDPTFPGTDHTREAVPVLACGALVRPGGAIGSRDTFSDLAATVADYLNLTGPAAGKSFLPDISLK